MELLQIKRTEFNLGLKKEYRFFQISDMHISYCDSISSDEDVKEHSRCEVRWQEQKKEFASDNNEFCDDRYNIESTVIFERLLDHAKKFNPDAIILSGDIMDRITDSNVRYLEGLFSKINVPIIYCLGNHDYMDIDHGYTNPYEILKPFTKHPEFNIIDYDEFTILAVDNNKQISDSQLALLKEQIEGDKKLLLVEHKPLLLGEFGEKHLDRIGAYFFLGTERDNEKTMEYVNLIKENSNRFIAVLCGHIHFASEYKITEDLMQISTSSGLIGAGREIIIK